MFEAVHQPLISVPRLGQVFTSLGKNAALGLGMFALRVLVVVTVWYELAALHDPVVDIIPPPPLNLVVRGSPRAELVLFIMKQTGVQSVGPSPGSDGPLPGSTKNVAWVSNDVKLSIDGAGQYSLEHGRVRGKVCQQQLALPARCSALSCWS